MLGVLDAVLALFGYFIAHDNLALFDEDDFGNFLELVVENCAPLLLAWLEHPQQLHHKVTITGVKPVVVAPVFLAK